MKTLEQITERAKALPPDKQREVLDFVEFLRSRARKVKPLQSPAGLWEGLGVSLSDEDIARVRREMWGNFPREDI